MITIDQLLESVDLDFEPRWVTKNAYDVVSIWGGDKKPTHRRPRWWGDTAECKGFGTIKLAEFENKDWQECIYEVPRKTTGNEIEQKMLEKLEQKLNDIVDAAIDAVNELKGANNE